MKFAFFLYLFLSLIAFTYEVTAATCNSRKTACINRCNKNQTGVAQFKCKFSCNTDYAKCLKNVK